MVNELKENWKIVLAGLITAIVVVCLWCCNSEVEEVPVQELTDEEIEKLF